MQAAGGQGWVHTWCRQARHAREHHHRGARHLVVWGLGAVHGLAYGSIFQQHGKKKKFGPTWLHINSVDNRALPWKPSWKLHDQDTFIARQGIEDGEGGGGGEWWLRMGGGMRIRPGVFGVTTAGATAHMPPCSFRGGPGGWRWWWG